MSIVMIGVSTHIIWAISGYSTGQSIGVDQGVDRSAVFRTDGYRDWRGSQSYRIWSLVIRGLSGGDQQLRQRGSKSSPPPTRLRLTIGVMRWVWVAG